MRKNQNNNVTHLNSYSYNKTLENIRRFKHKRFVRIRMGIILACGIALIGITSLPSINNTRKTTEINKQYVEATNKLEDLQNERKQMEYQVGLLEDEEYIAKLARKDLNLSKENEILINLPEMPEKNSAKETTERINEEENESE